MSVETTWNKIITQIKETPIEIATVPISQREPLWFRVYMENGDLYVENAVNHKPPTKMSMSRKVTEKDFTKVYPYYLRRAKGDNSKSYEVQSLSINASYIYALIAHFE